MGERLTHETLGTVNTDLTQATCPNWILYDHSEQFEYGLNANAVHAMQVHQCIKAAKDELTWP